KEVEHVELSRDDARSVRRAVATTPHRQLSAADRAMCSRIVRRAALVARQCPIQQHWQSHSIGVSAQATRDTAFRQRSKRSGIFNASAVIRAPHSTHVAHDFNSYIQ